MRVAVLGKSGQVARELARRAPPSMTVKCHGRDTIDLSDTDTVRDKIAALHCDAIVNAAAYTAVDRAESEPDAAQTLNATTPGIIAAVAAERGWPLLHYSTDYVFDGSGKNPRKPDAPVKPLGIYGRTKLDGETAIASAGGPHVILRTSWVFSAHGRNFVKAMLQLSETHDHLRVVSDQIGGPTAAADIADATFAILPRLAADPTLSGTYHFAGAPHASWADFARAIFRGAGRPVVVQDIGTEDYPTPAARPRNSRLDCATTFLAFGVREPDWRASLAEVLADLGVRKE